MTIKNEQARRAIEHAVAALGMMSPNAPSAALMRHAARGKIPKGDPGDGVPLTPQGERDAEEMGRALCGRVSALRHSPVPRCGKTAAQIQRGANASAPVEWRPLNFYAFVPDVDAATPTLLRLVNETGFYDHFVSAMSDGNKAPYPGFAPPRTAAAELAARMMSDGNGVCVNITHDWLVNVTASHVSGQAIQRADYTGYLDAVFLWEENGRAMFYHKGKSAPCARDFQREYDNARARHKR